MDSKCKPISRPQAIMERHVCCFRLIKFSITTNILIIKKFILNIIMSMVELSALIHKKMAPETLAVSLNDVSKQTA